MPVAEAAATFVGEDDLRGIVRVGRWFELGKALVDKERSAVLVLAGGDVDGGFEELEVGLDAGDFGGGFLGFFGPDRFHFLVGEAVEVDLCLGAAAHGGEGGGFECAFENAGHAVIDLVDGFFEAFGDAFVEAGGGGGVLTAEGAPLVGLVGGGPVGDAVAVVLGQAPASTRGAVLFDAFA